MSSEQFLWLNQDAELVLGASRAAIYDFKSGHVFSLNAVARQIVTQLLQGAPLSSLSETESSFVQQLINRELGEIGSTPSLTPPHRKQQQAPFLPRLKFLWLELTDSCNLRCVHCYMNATHVSELKSVPARARPSLTNRDWMRVIQQGAELGCRAVQFTGGEPLLHPDLLALIDTARQLEYSYIEVFTNGTLLNESLSAQLKARDVQLAISLHAVNAVTHDQVTLVPGSYARAQQSVQMISKHEIPVRFGTTTLKTNQNELFANSPAPQALRGNNVLRPIGRGANSNLNPDQPQIIESAMKSAPDFQTSRASFEYARHWNICWAGKMAITASGDVIPCVFGRERVVGNVNQESLHDLISSPNLQSLWGFNKDRVEVCRDCEYRYACSDCRPLAEKLNGELDAKTARCTYDPYTGEWSKANSSFASLDDDHQTNSPIVFSVTKIFDRKDPFHRSEDECDPDRPPSGDEDFTFAFPEAT